MKKAFLLLFLGACSRYETPDLPDLDRKSFSSEEIFEKQNELKKRVRIILSKSDGNSSQNKDHGD
jgi:hypothetical protein